MRREVGQNLMDHLGRCRWASTSRGDTLFAAEKPMQLLNYLIRRRGMLTSNGGEAYGFVRSRPELDTARPRADLRARHRFSTKGIGDPYDGHAVVIGPDPAETAQPRQHHVALVRPDGKPIIDPRYLTDDDGVDRAALMAGLRSVRQIAEHPPLRAFIGKIARPLGATNLDEETLEKALNTCRTPSITRSAPAEWATTTPAWWTHSCGCAASTDCGSPTRR